MIEFWFWYYSTVTQHPYGLLLYWQVGGESADVTIQSPSQSLEVVHLLPPSVYGIIQI